MKNITFSAEESLIEQARQIAHARDTTLNAAFREWLQDYAAQPSRAEDFDALMEQLTYVEVDRKYTRDERNQR